MRKSNWKTDGSGRRFPIKGLYEIRVRGKTVETARDQVEALELGANYESAEIFYKGNKVASLTKAVAELRTG